MKLLLFILLIFLSVADLPAELKYGFLGKSDEDLLERVREVGISSVILGCVYRCEVKPEDKAFEFHVTVIDSYIGPLKTGDKIFISIAAEEGLKPEAEIGNLRFFLLRKLDKAVPLVTGAFVCEWADNIQYGHPLHPASGEPLRKFLRENVSATTAAVGEPLFFDDFRSAPASPWKWLRENPAGWRTSAKGLEVNIEPGNMWGPPNDAKNVLIRPAPDTSSGEIEITVAVTNQPNSQYEQVDLVWYYDDSHMVKIGQEMVDGKLSIVMGREEKDRTSTMAILPLKASTVKLRLLVKGATIRGQYQPDGAADWKDAGTCTAPVPENGKPHISLQFYQGAKDAPHWGRATGFTIKRLP